tara:strand:+ start:230 stop:778 length:549 start_codon:yes stop_codon:yes gene_type:complete
VRNNIYILFFILFLFSCNENNQDNDVAISELEKRFVDLNNQISSLNLDISRLDSTISSELKILKVLSDSTFKLANNYSEIKKDQNSFKSKKVNFIDPEKLFKEKFNIITLSVLTCTLRDIDENKIVRFYKEDLVEVLNDDTIEQYSIIDINRTERFIKVKSINYNKEFILYMDIEQNKNREE